ncbi:MAG: hypothetical protein HY568_03160, partial [Candidatus Latescibacteria bacterium]|nr:hypothetical protein [Candidatus Latescibacterota bacterium]
MPQPARFDSVAVDGAAYVRVSIQGAPVTEEPGRPALPTIMIPVGVPDGMSANVRVVSADWEDRAGLPPPLPVVKQRFVADDPKTGPVTEERYEPDPAIYGGGETYPGEAVSLGEGGPLGDLWMIPAFVRPVRYDTRKGRYSVLSRMTLRVEFVSASASELRRRPAQRPGAVAGEGGWKRLQRSMVRNFDAATTFPRRLTPGALGAPRAPSRAGAGNPEFRISVKSTGWSSVSYAALAAAGFPSGVPIAEIGVWERGYDDVGDSATATPIPVVARDAGTAGVFDAGDAITFYARNLRDRVGPLSIENRYTDANTYWLTWTGATAAVVPDSISGSIADPSPLMPTSFQDMIHLEQNSYIMPWPSSTAGVPQENVEHFFWTTGLSPDAFAATIPFLDPDASSPFRIRARYQGQQPSSGTSTHRLSIVYVGSTGVTDTLAANQTFFGQSIYVLDTGLSIPGSHIGAGNNQYTHVGTRPSPDGLSFVDGSRALLDWVEVTYARQYVARGDVLQFSSPSGGVAEIAVHGFTQSGVEVYDLTDPTAPLFVTDVAVTAVGPTYDIAFRTDATAGARRFVALVPGSEAAISAQAIRADTPSALWTPAPYPPGAFARAILIAPEEFLAPANRLADFRRGQGFVVEVATVQDVYDEFNGGIKSAAAIRRYLLHGYRAWTPRPAFAALLGDASIDYRHHLSTSAVDWVPTYLAFEAIAGPNGAELVANEAFFVLNFGGGTGSAEPFTPSMFLGRVPASSAAELDQYVTKVIQYENFQPTDTWRGKQLLLSDDEFSSTIFFNQGYCFQPAEATFRLANQDMADAAATSPSGSDLVSEPFDLKGLTDPLAATCPGSPPGCRNITCVVNAFRGIGGAVDSFHAVLGRGQLILNVEAHANRYLISHEQIYSTSFGDLSRIANVNRPNFYMIWGCHANQFPDAPSGSFTDSTDSFGEQWIMLPDRGSIGGLGSSGYELLNTNAAMNSFVADALYSTPPAPDPPPGEPRQARWILGEIVGQAFVRNANSGSFLQQAMNRTINLLGDPMIHLDALPPRIFEVTTDGNIFAENGFLTTDSPTDSMTLVAKVRDEAGLQKTDLAERPVSSGIITPLDPASFTVAVSDTGRAHTLTAKVRPRIGNYDLLVRSADRNDR